MKIYVGIDDSHRRDGGGAGETASLLTKVLEENRWGQPELPSRHRLYQHPDTGCRKHNTARSFSAQIEERYLSVFIDYACKVVRRDSSPDSNAGLVIAISERMTNTDEIIAYASRVKEGLVSRDETNRMIGKQGLHVFELSGNGKGIIGALAAAGLRMTGNDGQFRGKLQLGSGDGYIATVQEIIENTHVEQIKNMDLENIDKDQSVRMGEKVKVVLLEHKYTLMVFPTELQYPRWQTSTTHMLRMF